MAIFWPEMVLQHYGEWPDELVSKWGVGGHGRDEFLDDPYRGREQLARSLQTASVLSLPIGATT